MGLTTKSFSYNAIGNVVTKSDVGTYNYPLPTAARPHAVSSITGTVNGFVNPSFTYDADGNMLTGLGRTLTYTSFDMPLTVAGVRFAGGPSYNYTYTYNAEHERTRLVHSTLGTFIYVHPAGRGELLYEKEIKPGGLVEHKNYINAGGLLIGVIIKRSNGTGDTNYFHQDRLGSLTLITNTTGGVVERLAYDAWGKRRNPNGTDSTNNSLFGINTDRGFTGHEHLDEVALIHMNGRIYDPVIARFVTPDPQVQWPTQLQSYNRYSYGFNNPLAGMDPTGYGFWSDLISDPIGTIFHTVEKVVNAALDNPIKTIATIAVAYFTGIYVGDILGAGSLIGSAAGGFAGGLVGSGGDFKAALIGGVTAGAFNWAGGAFMDSPLQLVAAHATIGCASAVASGGSCRAGALSAGFSKDATLGLNEYTTWDALSKGIAVTVIGGTASVLGGGKFENGAVTAAYGYLFNQLSTDKRGAGPNERHAEGVRQAAAEYIASGWSVVTTAQAEAWIPGFDSARKYDLIVLDPSSERFLGVEVKTTIVGVIRLDRSQVIKDVAVLQQGANVPSLGLTITGVGYKAYCFACNLLDTRSKTLQNALSGAGIPYEGKRVP